MIDTQRLQTLRSEIGNEGVSLLAGVFLDEADQILDRLLTQSGELSAGLHALHGSALNLGLRQLAQLCAKAEKAAQSQGGQRIDLEEISASYAKSRAAFIAALQSSD